MSERRVVHLRAEVNGADRRYLEAYLERGHLVLAGQDLGPSTESVSDDGEYEWFRTVRDVHLSVLISALGGQTGEDVLDVLARVATGDGSYMLEQLLRAEVVPNEVDVV